MNVLGGALRAGLRHAPRVSAVMALEAVALFVIRERDAAVLTLNSRATRAADDEPRIPAAIDQDQGLRALIEARGDGFAELRGKRARPIRGPEIFTQIQNFHPHKRTTFHPPSHLHHLIFA